MNLALFDLDHTLLPIDSDYSWGEFSLQIGWTDPVVFKAKNDQFFADYQAGVLDIRLRAICHGSGPFARG